MLKDFQNPSAKLIRSSESGCSCPGNATVSSVGALAFSIHPVLGAWTRLGRGDAPKQKMPPRSPFNGAQRRF